MAASPAPNRTLRVLFRDLFIAAFIGAVIYTSFTAFNSLVFRGFTQPEVLLVEAGAIVLVAFLVARSLTAASDAILVRRGQRQHGAAIRIFLNLLIAVGTVLALFRLAGVDAQSIFLGSAFAGIVLGLAAQTVLANAFAGLLLVFANPFRPGDRVSLVSSSYPIIWPSYPHEAGVPGYHGTIEDVGLFYTVLGLDGGGRAKVPNSVVLTALVLERPPGAPHAHRVRMTFPISVPVGRVEATLAQVAASVPAGGPTVAPPRLEVTDIAPTTWDGAITVWTPLVDETDVRDRVMRAVLPAVAPRDSGPARPTA